MPTSRFAHSKPGRPLEEWHDLAEHLVETSRLASEFAKPFGAAEWGRLAGLWHDLGKYSDAFQNYLHSSSGIDEVHESEVRGKIDHSTAGARHAAGRGPLGRLLAYVIAGHHAGLPDNEGGGSCLRSRLIKQIERLPDDELPRSRLGLDHPLPAPPQLRPAVGSREQGFSLAFFTRMLFSCLVDADFLNTEAFMNPERASVRRPSAASPGELLARLEAHLAKKRDAAAKTPVNDRRAEVLDACREAAALEPGFFSLEVPTGGGKTLSSLAFALRHAVEKDLRRVVYAIPFTSIIEQTADVFREALGDLSDEVLEHHGALDRDDPERQSARNRLASENFDAPLIATTNVQLFESMMAARPSRCRKLHRLARSVIVLDEAQTLPPWLLTPTLAALKELVNHYGSSVVFCTATQPAVEFRETFTIGLRDVRPIVKESDRLHKEMTRAVYPWLAHSPASLNQPTTSSWVTCRNASPIAS